METFETREIGSNDEWHGDEGNEGRELKLKKSKPKPYAI